jgi:hypothetical protein
MNSIPIEEAQSEKTQRKRGVIRLALRDIHPSPALKARPNKAEKKHQLTKPTLQTIKLRSNQRKVRITLNGCQ